MGNFTRKDGLRIGVALILLTLPYGLLAWFFAPKLNDPFGIWFSPNLGFTATASILTVVGLFFIALSIFLNRKH